MHQKKETTSIFKLCTAALLLAIGILLPQVFHLVGGQAMGGMFLPMHIPVFIAGLLLGPSYGVAVGTITPLLSFLFTGMPPAAKLPFMLLELLTYGLLSGLLRKRCPLFISLIVAQVGGRLVNVLALLTATYLLQLNVPPAVTVGTAVVTGVPGLAVQLIFIPAAVMLLEHVLPFTSRSR